MAVQAAGPSTKAKTFADGFKEGMADKTDRSTLAALKNALSSKYSQQSVNKSKK